MATDRAPGKSSPIRGLSQLSRPPSRACAAMRHHPGQCCLKRLGTPAHGCYAFPADANNGPPRGRCGPGGGRTVGCGTAPERRDRPAQHRDRQIRLLADPGGGPGLGRQRDRQQGVRRQLQCLARAAVAAVRRGVHAVRRLHLPQERAYPHRHRQQPPAQARARLDRPARPLPVPDAVRALDVCRRHPVLRSPPGTQNEQSGMPAACRNGRPSS